MPRTEVDFETFEQRLGLGGFDKAWADADPTGGRGWTPPAGRYEALLVGIHYAILTTDKGDKPPVDQIEPEWQIVTTPDPSLTGRTFKGSTFWCNDKGLGRLKAFCCQITNTPVQEAKADPAQYDKAWMFSVLKAAPAQGILATLNIEYNPAKDGSRMFFNDNIVDVRSASVQTTVATATAAAPGS